MADSTKKVALDLQGVRFGANATPEQLNQLSQGITSNIDLQAAEQAQKDALQKKGSTVQTLGSGYGEFWDTVLSHNYTDGTMQGLISRYKKTDEADPNFNLDVRGKMVDNIDASRKAAGEQPLTLEQRKTLMEAQSSTGFDYLWTHMQNVEQERKWQQSGSKAVDITAGLVAGFGDVSNVIGLGTGAIAGAATKNVVSLAKSGGTLAARAATAADFATDVATGIAGSRIAAGVAGEDHTTDDDFMAAGMALAFKGVVDAGAYAAKRMHETYKARSDINSEVDAPVIVEQSTNNTVDNRGEVQATTLREELQAGKTADEINSESGTSGVVERLPDNFELKQEHIVDGDKILTDADEIVGTINDFRKGKMTKEELVNSLEVNSKPEVAELAKNVLDGGESSKFTADELSAFNQLRTQNRPKGMSITDFIRTKEGAAIFENLKAAAAEARSVQEQATAKLMESTPEVQLQKALVEEDKVNRLGRPVERMSVADTIGLMQDIATMPRENSFSDAEKVLKKSRQVDVYRINDDGSRERIRHTLKSNLQYALFYAHKSTSGPITAKRRLALDYIRKHYPSYSDDDITQAARAFRLELQRPDTRFNPERALKDREAEIKGLTRKELETPEMTALIGRGIFADFRKLAALTSRTKIDVYNEDYHWNSAVLMELFTKNSDGVTGYDKLKATAEQKVKDIDNKLRALERKEMDNEVTRKALIALEQARAQWRQINDDNLSDLAVRVRALVQDSNLSEQQLKKIYDTYRQTAAGIGSERFSREQAAKDRARLAERRASGSKVADPEGNYALKSAVFEYGDSLGKRAALEAILSNNKIPFIESLVAAGKIKVVETPKEITHGNHPDDVLGMYDRTTDTTYLVAGNLTSAAQLDTILMHEATHAQLPKVLGTKGYNGLIKQALNNEDFKAVREEVIASYGLDPVKDKNLIGEEVLARLVESSDMSNHSVVKELLSAFKAWLLKTFGENIVKLSQADLAHIVVRSLRKQAREAYIDYAQGPNIFTPVPATHPDYQMYALSNKLNTLFGKIPQVNSAPIKVSHDIGLGRGIEEAGANLVYRFETSENPFIRKAGRMLFTNRDAGTTGLTEHHDRVTKQLRNTIQASFRAPFDLFRKENGVLQTVVDTPKSVELAKKFANEIGEAMLTGNMANGESVNQAVKLVQQHVKRIQREVVNERNSLETFIGQKLEADDPLSEFADQVLADDYIPTKINRDKLEAMRIKLKGDDKALVAFVADAINAPGMSPKEKRTYAAALVKAIMNESNPATRQAVEAMTSGAGNVAHVLELTGLYSSNEIDAVRAIQLANRKSSRPVFDANYNRDIPGVGQVQMMDLLETDVNILLNSFMSKRVSAITMSQGIRNGATSLEVPYQASMPAYILDVDGVAHLNFNNPSAREYLKTLAAESLDKSHPDVHEAHMQAMEDSFRLLDGGEFDDSPSGAGYDILAVLSNMGNVTTGWGFNMSIISEFTKQLASTPKAMSLFVSDLLQGFRNGSNSFDTEYARDMAEMLGVGFNSAVMPGYDPGAHGNALSKAKDLTGMAAKGVFRVTGFTTLNNYTAMLAVRAHLSAMKQAHVRGEKLPEAFTQHMILNGIPENKMDRVLEYAAKVYNEGTGRLNNSNAGYEDVDTYLKAYLNLVSKLATSESPFGSLPGFAYRKAGKMFMQYRGSMIASQVVNTQFGAKHFNKQVAAEWMGSLVGGALSYIAATILRYHSDSKKLQKKLQPQEIMLQSFGRASFAGMMPMFTDAALVITGFNPLFSGAQYRDTFTLTPAPLRTAAEIMSGISGLSSTVNPWADSPSKQEKEAALKMMGGAAVLTYGLGPTLFGESK